MRAHIFELRPESLEKGGFVATLEKQAAAVQARHGIRIETAFGEEPDAALMAKECLYRIAQEALHNTVKHARAANVAIKLGRDFEGITLEVLDDGVGFDAGDDFPVTRHQVDARASLARERNAGDRRDQEKASESSPESSPWSIDGLGEWTQGALCTVRTHRGEPTPRGAGPI